MKIKDSKFITGGQLNEEYKNAIQNKIITQELITDITSRANWNSLSVFQDYYDEIYSADIKPYILDHIGKDLSTNSSEEFRTDYRLILAYFIYNADFDQYVEELHEKTMGKYSIRKMLQFRFIREHDPKRYEIIDNEVEDTNIKLNDKDEDLFENYLKTSTNHLEKIIKEITEKTLSERIKGFNCLDYCFFNFILDTYDTHNAQNYRNKDYHLVDPYYISIIEYGITAIAKCYYSDIDREFIKKKLKRIRDLSNQKLTH